MPTVQCQPQFSASPSSKKPPCYKPVSVKRSNWGSSLDCVQTTDILGDVKKHVHGGGDEMKSVLFPSGVFPIDRA